MAIFIYSCVTGRTPPHSFRKLASCAFTSAHALNSVSEYRKQKSLAGLLLPNDFALAFSTSLYSGDHKFVQNNAAFLLANLSMSKVNLAVL